MMEVEIGNVTEAIANLTEHGASEPVVKATIALSESGFVSVSDAFVTTAAEGENTIPLTVNVKFTSVAPLTVSEKKISRNRYV